MNIQEELTKKYKRDDILILGSSLLNEVKTIYPTGAMALDIATGIGGLPGGRITELFGIPAGGKTTVALSTIGRLHENKIDDFAAYVDLENAIDIDYAVRCGVDLDRLYVCRPEYGEQAFDVAEQLIRSGSVSIVVIDSIPAISPRAEVEGEMGDAHFALLARLMSQFLRKTAFAIRESGVAVIFINQVRAKIGKLPFPMLDTPGGWAIKHHSSMRISLRNDGELKTGDGTTYGSKIDFVVKKNKAGNSYGVGSFEIWGDRGICGEAGLLDVAIEKDIIKQSGAWFKYKDTVIGQGRLTTIQELSNNSELKGEVERGINAS